jgi:hypothetical protein
VEPRLTGGVVVLRSDRFVVNMRKVATQARDLLRQPLFRIGHEFPIALIPQRITVGDGSWNATAVGLNSVFRHEIRVERR